MRKEIPQSFSKFGSESKFYAKFGKFRRKENQIKFRKTFDAKFGKFLLKDFRQRLGSKVE